MNFRVNKSAVTVVALCLLVLCLGYIGKSQTIDPVANTSAVGASFGRGLDATRHEFTLSGGHIPAIHGDPSNKASSRVNIDQSISYGQQLTTSEVGDAVVNIGEDLDPNKRYQEFSSSPAKDVNIGEYKNVDALPSLEVQTNEVINIGPDAQVGSSQAVTQSSAELIQIGEALGDPYNQRRTALSVPVNIGPSLDAPTLALGGRLR